MSDDEILYNPLLPEFHADPYPFYKRLREKEPVHQTPMSLLGAHALGRLCRRAARSALRA